MEDVPVCEDEGVAVPDGVALLLGVKGGVAVPEAVTLGEAPSDRLEVALAE